MGGHFIGAGLAWCYVGKGKNLCQKYFLLSRNFFNNNIVVHNWLEHGSWTMFRGAQVKMIMDMEIYVFCTLTF